MQDLLCFENAEQFQQSHRLIEQAQPDILIKQAISGVHEHQLVLQSTLITQDQWRVFVIQNGLHPYSHDFLDFQHLNPARASELFHQHRSQ